MLAVDSPHCKQTFHLILLHALIIGQGDCLLSPGPPCHRLKLGGVEYGVDLPASWQLQPVCLLPHTLHHWEGSCPATGQLPLSCPEWQMCRRQPDALAHRKLDITTLRVSYALHAHFGSFQGGGYLGVNLGTSRHKVLDSRKLHSSSGTINRKYRSKTI